MIASINFNNRMVREAAIVAAIADKRLFGEML